MMNGMASDAWTVFEEAECLYTHEEVDGAIDGMVDGITAAVAGKDPLVLTVMTGGLVFAGVLLPRLDFALELDYIHATRYGEQTSGGKLQWLASPHASLRDRTVLIIDDILDEGHTLAAIVEHCRVEGASEVYSAVLVNKIHDRRFGEMKADFVGVDVADRYVFGYGMDYKGYLRNAPGIYAVKGL